MMHKENKIILTTVIWMILWSGLWMTFLISLPGFSEYDTSKYLTIAEQMMQQHQYLLAYWDGHIYSDKPPLLFWLMISGWKLFGFSTWWPQAIVLSLATASIFVTQRLAKLLWPETLTYPLIPFILIGCFHWVWFAKEIRVDGILVLATLLSLYSIVQAIQEKNRYWLLYILSIGLGGFAKGPVILVFILLPALFLPSLLNRTQASPKWYALLGFATILGLCIPLSWAIPAALSAGTTFTQDIFFNQIAHRASQHQESIWFYLVRLPLWLLPWSLYPPAWHGLKLMKIKQRPSGESICLLMILSGVILFSVFGQKLPHYLYPLFPIFALLIARLCTLNPTFNHRDQWVMGFFLLGFCAFCLLYPLLSPWLPHDTWARGYFLQEINLVKWGGIFLLGTLIFFLIKVKTQQSQIMLIATSSVLLALFVNNVVLSCYQKHLSDNTVLTGLAHLPTHQIAVLQAQNIQSPAITQYIQTHHLRKLSTHELAEWKTTHPYGWVLTPRFQDFKKAPSPTWYYQTRYSMVGLLPSALM